MSIGSSKDKKIKLLAQKLVVLLPIMNNDKKKERTGYFKIKNLNSLKLSVKLKIVTALLYSTLHT